MDRSFVRSIAWTAGAKWSGQLLTSGISLLIARILLPADYGLVGMAVVFLGLVRFLSEFGIGGSVVILREFDRDRLAGLNTYAVLFGLAGWAVTVACAVPLGRFFGAPKLPLLIVVMSVSFLISAFRTVPGAVLQRDFRFRLLAGIDLFQALAAAATTLVLAWKGAGYWALVLGNVGASVMATVITMVLSPQRFARPRFAQLRPAVAMSGDITASTLGWYVYSNADFLVVGKVLGQTALGLYDVGWTLAMLIVERVTSLIGGVAPAYLAAAKGDLRELRRYLFRISASISLLTFPASFGLALVADDFCRVILGPRWLGAIGALRLLAIYAGIRSLAPLLAQIMNILGQHRFVARNSISAAIGMPVAFWIGSHWGLQGVALAWVVAYPMVAAPLLIRVLRALNIGAADYARALRPAVVSSAVMVVSVLVLRLFTRDMYAVTRLGLAVGLGATVYALVLFVGFGARTDSLIRALRGTESGDASP